MKKLLPLLLIVFFFSAGWSPTDVLPIYKNLKVDIVTQLNDLFAREVSVGSVTGLLVNQIELNDVAIARDKKLADGTIIKAKKIIINYNPLKFASSRGNIVPAISKITIENPEVYVDRSIKDEWNVAKLLPITKSPEGKTSPLQISATIIIKDGYGKYVDHMGWGEPLNGKAFISDAKDFNAEVKISGTKVNIICSATSIVGKSVAQAKVNGNVNFKNGKYKFVVYANNVDISKWASYTMNIPDFRAKTGLSNMVLTMTNPPPRKKGQPILFDGKFNIFNGTAKIFNVPFTDMNGFIRVFDEEVTFKDMSGTHSGINVIANGRLYDFSVANYDIDLDIPFTSLKTWKKAANITNDIPITGKASAMVHIGGTYSAPKIDGVLGSDAFLYSQKLSGNIKFLYEGSVLAIDSPSISVFGGQLTASSIVDLTPSTPNISLNVTAESIDLKKIHTRSPFEGKMSGNIKAAGPFNDMNIEARLLGSASSELTALGKITGSGMNIKIDGKHLPLDRSYGTNPINELSATVTGNENNWQIPALSISIGTSKIKASINSSPALSEIRLQTQSAEASDIPLFSTFVPNELRPVIGTTDIDVLISGKGDLVNGITSTSIEGSISLTKGHVASETVDRGSISFLYLPGLLRINEGHLINKYSNTLFKGSFSSSGAIDMEISGDLDLGNLKPYTMKYGRLYGISNIDMKLKGKISDPSVDIKFNVSDLRYNEIILDSISGHMKYFKKRAELDSPVEIKKDNDEYRLTGAFNIATSTAEAIKFEILKGDLSTIFPMVEEINNEIRSKQILSGAQSQKNIKIDPSIFKFPLKPIREVYNSENTSHVGQRIKAEIESASFGDTTKERSMINVAGSLFGYFELNGKFSDPTGRVYLKLNDCTIESYSFKEGLINCGINNGKFKADSVYIAKDDGKMDLVGTYDTKGPVSIEVSADKMPVDFLSLFFGRGKPFSGVFNMKTKIFGRSSSPKGNIELDSGAVQIAGVELDSMRANINFSDNSLMFNEASLSRTNGSAALYGKLPFDDSPMNLVMTMEGNTIGLLTLGLPDITWREGSGLAKIKMTGNISKPKINGSLSLKGADIFIKPINSALSSINSDIIITNNIISTDALSAKWSGNWTANAVNKIKLHGSMDLNKAFSGDRTISLDVAVSDNSLVVDIPNFYKGDVEVSNFIIKGPLSISNIEQAPAISGNIALTNGVITLPDMSKKAQLLPLGMDIKLIIKKNTYVSAGDVKNLLSTDFSNLMLNLEIASDGLDISGSLDDLKLTGKTSFKRGTVSILNRDFSLMTEDRQKEVFGSSLDKVKANEATFSGGSLPYLSLSAEINVKSVEKVGEPLPGETAQYQTKNVLVISRVTGTPYSKDKDSGINLSFDSFLEDTSVSPAELIPGKYDQEEIKVLLLPDFIKSPLRISEQGVGGVSANDVVADYLNSRLNSYLLRDVERNIARQLDLESLTLEYNFGKDIKNMMPEKETPSMTTQTTAPETMYGIGAVKGFFDKFYIDMKYMQASQEQTVINKTYLNYQLTYKLSPIVSVIYYREPFSFIEEESDYYKVTLKAGYQL
jgi:hypothetical protein